VRTRAVRVIHLGARQHDEYRQLMRVTMLALGAVSAKLLRRHPLAGSWYLLGVAWRLVVRVAIVDLASGRRPPVFGRGVYLVKGLAAGLRTPLQPGPALLFEQQPDTGL